ncbi:hypothetical protein GCM10007853_07690 [Algimonas ampicilliniresistens]|uniref:DUF2783 domain-containing protein n=1 Tax=Algimonas ampicilliniresistens TaxID=1298735 RepID=A0ABQ5V8A5_9PROT|nr:hypothetical protein [Algimonas ampicilliniresistens]GLQ22895.1 hypothetical protein GCM10007853_07690 [Algimonas ampicilliniresistens]
MASNKTDTTLDILNSMEEREILAYLVAHALELSEMALNAGQPQASALLTLAASNLRKDAG